MKPLIILAVLLASAAPARTHYIRNWECADGVSISYIYNAAHKMEDKRESFGISVEGKDAEHLKPVKGSATITFKFARDGYHEAIYLNGKRCRETF
jgi:hypothetical protein